MEEMYLIFERREDICVSFIRAASLTDAVRAYLDTRTKQGVVTGPDGSIIIDRQSYAHPLAFIEAGFKTDGEWQIRQLPKEACTATVTEFWGDDTRYPAEMIDACRPYFRKAFPRSRAKAFAWYLEQGTLVTFYHKPKPYTIIVLARYLWSWASGSLTIEEWHGDYQALADSLSLKPYQLIL